MVTPFTDIADGPCTSTDELLLSLAAEFWPVDGVAARAGLDEEARRLFGAPALAPADCAHLLAGVLDHDLRIAPKHGSDPELLRFDVMLQRRRAHPLLIAALGVELLRRAGVPAAVCSSPTRWFVGIARPDGTVLLDARLSGHDDPCPDRVRRHCAHEIAFCALTGLAERFARSGLRSRARLALALRLALPVDEAVRVALQRDLDAFGP
jgi:Transglutaminase-like superfamily